MASSRAYQKFAELYYERHLPIVDADIDGQKGRIVFEDDKSKIEVTGEDQQFIDIIQNLVPTVRDGTEHLIDIRDMPAGSLQTYLENMQYFTSNEEDPIRAATIKINRGELSPPSDFDETEALQASVELNFSNDELRKLIENYSEISAVKQSDANKMNQPFRKYRDNASYNEERFEEVYEMTVDLLKEVYLNGSPLNCYKEWHETCETDLLNLSQKILDLKDRKQVEWNSLKSRDWNTTEGNASIRFWENKADSIEIGEVEAKIGIERIIEQYSKLFELAREPLRDLAAALDESGTVDLTNMTEVLRFLASNDKQSFTESIEPQLRHGSAHASIETDDSNGVLRIYHGRGKNQTLAKKMDYVEVPPAYYDLSDMVASLLFAMTRVNDRVTLRYMSSQEFRSRMVENIPPGEFSG